MTALLRALPWQRDLWSDWLRQLEAGRLPHAVLLTGAKGLGKRDLAQALAHTLFCTADIAQRPCGRCKACELIAADSHPDLRLVEPESPGKAVRVDQVRELVGFLGTTAQQGGWKCVIIEPADAMNNQAANALLKSLEEPPGSSLIFLVSSSWGRLLPTLRSRCRQLQLKVPPRALALEWLEPRIGTNTETFLDYAHGAPCAALAAAETKAVEQRQHIEKALLALATGRTSMEDAVKLFLESPVIQAIDDLLVILSGLARAQACGDWGTVGSEWPHLLQAWDRRLLFRFRDKVVRSKQELLSSANPNPQLLWEDILISWKLVAGSSSPR